MHYVLIPNRGRSAADLSCHLLPLIKRSINYNIKIVVADNGSANDALLTLSTYQKEGLIYKLLTNGRDLGFWYSVYRLLLSIETDSNDLRLSHISFTFLDPSDDISVDFFDFVSSLNATHEQAIYVPTYLKSKPFLHCKPHSMEQNLINKYLATIDDSVSRLKMYHYLPGVCGLNNIIWGSSITMPTVSLVKFCHEIKTLLIPSSGLCDHLIETAYCAMLYYMFSVRLANYTYTRMLDIKSSDQISFPLAVSAVCHAIYGKTSQYDQVSSQLLRSCSIRPEHKRIIEQAMKIRSDLVQFFGQSI